MTGSGSFTARKGVDFRSPAVSRIYVPVGWMKYLWSPVGSVEVTSFAVELMEIYGIPDDLDLNWVRSFLRPLFIRLSHDKLIAAVTLDRLNRLPGVKQPTGSRSLYYERSLIAAAVLVGLCIYATLSSPMPRAVGTNDGSSPPESFRDAGSI